MNDRKNGPPMMSDAEDEWCKHFESADDPCLMAGPNAFEITTSPRAMEIETYCDQLRDTLVRKNASYGDSVSRPVNIFFRGGPTDTIASQIDHKLARVANGTEYPGEDTIKDLIGYLVLYAIDRKKAAT